MYFRRRGPYLEVHAPAKLNLFLEILSRRADGFHELETVLSAINLYDTLQLSGDSNGIRLEACWASGFEARRRAARLRSRPTPYDELPAAADNLVLRAAERLRADAGTAAGAVIRLIKRIPAAAGLGGASSDAAATLLGLNRLWELNYGIGRLAKIASELGSDIPFFLGRGPTFSGQDPSRLEQGPFCLAPGTAICRGRGERVEPVRTGGRLHFVLVRPPEGLSTAAVYGRCRPPRRPQSPAGLLAALRRGDPRGVARELHNRLERPAGELSDWVRRLREEFARLGCLGHQMSGSGTTYFGLVRSGRCARRAASRLRAAGMEGAFAAHTIRLTNTENWSNDGPQGEMSWKSPRCASS